MPLAFLGRYLRDKLPERDTTARKVDEDLQTQDKRRPLISREKYYWERKQPTVTPEVRLALLYRKVSRS